MGLLVRIAFIVNFSSAIVYLVEFFVRFQFFSSSYDYYAVSFLISSVLSIRFLFAYRKKQTWEIDIAYNWGILLIVSQIINFQYFFENSPDILVCSTMTILQIMFAYKELPVIILNTLYISIIGVRLIQIDNEALLVMMAAFGLLIIGIRPLLKYLLGEISVREHMFAKARWAAAELTDILLHFNNRIEKEKQNTRIDMGRHLSREIHDSVGYMMTALIVQISVVREISETEEVKDSLLQLENMARATLQEIREEVTKLRKDVIAPTQKIHAAAQIGQICSTFSELTGITINLMLSDTVKPYLDETMKEPLSKIIQEAITNSYRHGMASLINVTLMFEQKEKKMLLHISDNGIGCSNVVPGNGLSGIMERASSLNGIADFQSMAGKGFDLGIDIPIDGKEK